MLDFDGADGKIVFGANTALDNLTTMTILSWVDPRTIGEEVTPGLNFGWIVGKTSSSPVGLWALSVYSQPAYYTNTLQFRRAFSGSSGGTWVFPDNSVTLNTQFFAVTYDASSASNDPLFYVDGALVATTEVVAPSGSVKDDSASYMYLGNGGSGNTNFDGYVMNVLVYNRILSASEIQDAYNSRLAIPTYNGLVFAPNLLGAAGGADDGDTLGATDYITDIISGAQGTPSGSPVLRSGTYLLWER